MSERLTLRRLRAFLRALAAALYAGAVVELLLVGHTDGPVQLIPFALCGLGLLALGAAWRRPGRWTVRALWVTMVIIACGAVVGVAQHLLGNLDFGRETLPEAGTARLAVAALTGAAPLLAPGMLAVAAALATASTYEAGGH
jgi:hypothetical protein